MGLYVISKDSKGKYYFELKNNNGKVILSSMHYMARKGALKGCRAVSNNAKTAKIQDETKNDFKLELSPKFKIYKKNGKFYVTLVAPNSKDVATSTGLANMAAAKQLIKAIKANCKSPLVAKTVNPANKADNKKLATKSLAKKAPAKKTVKKVAKKAIKKAAVKKAIKKVAKKKK